jgi:putative colanic acid biosynthesis acetyltransferase WcaF
MLASWCARVEPASQSSRHVVFAIPQKHRLCHLASRCPRVRMELRGYTTGDFERGASREKEALWFVMKVLFFLNPWPWPSALRVFLLRSFGARIGAGVVVRANVNVTFPWRLEIGDDVWIGEEVVLLSLAKIVIESNVCISQRAFLCTGSHRFWTRGFDLVTKPITVRGGSWIAAQVFIAPGMEIGAGSMVTAGSVVIENVPPGTVVRGNPAVPVPSRTDA